MKLISNVIVAFFLSTLVLADDVKLSGDSALGELAFKKQCVACHMIINSSGKKLAGRNGRAGPNLYGVVGQLAGVVDGYRYGKSIVAAGTNNGLAWDEKNFVAYVQDPKSFLQLFLSDKKARAKMTYKVRKEKDARNIYTYLLRLSEKK